MSPLEDNLSGITRTALKRLDENLILTKFVNRSYDGTTATKLSKWQIRYRRVARYLDNLKRAWLDAFKALAGVDPHEHCDEGYDEDY